MPGLVGSAVCQVRGPALKEAMEQNIPIMIDQALKTNLQAAEEQKCGVGGGMLVKEPVQRDGLQAGKLRLGSTLTEASGAVVNPKASGVDACDFVNVADCYDGGVGAASKYGDVGDGVLVEEPVQCDGVAVGDSPIVLVGDGLKIGEIVCIDGPVSSPALNGCVARIHGFDAQTGRYMLDLELGKGIKKFRRANFLTEEDLDDLGGSSCCSGTGCHDVVKDCIEEDFVDAVCVEDVVPCVSGNACLDELKFRRMIARSLSESLCAAPACH
jgi:hypothetical protein